MAINRLSPEKVTTYLNKKHFEGDGYKVEVLEDYYNLSEPRYILFYEGDELLRSEDWMEIVDYQKKHIKLTKLIMPEDDDD